MSMVKKGRKALVVDMKVINELIKESQKYSNQQDAIQFIREQYSSRMNMPKTVSTGWVWNTLNSNNLLGKLPRGQSGRKAGTKNKPKETVATMSGSATSPQTGTATVNSVERKLYGAAAKSAAKKASKAK